MIKLSKIKLALCVATIVSLYLPYNYGRAYWFPYYSKIMGKRTVSDVLDLYGEPSRELLKNKFNLAGVNYPPNNLTLLAIKDTATLEVWVETDQQTKLIHTYPIKALSGVSGPKLEEGDKQVPEGLYKIVGFNPNSAFHLSMKLNYPNAFDLKHAKAEGRKFPGTNIFIHGKAVSVGCLAMGDAAIEELFVMASDVTLKNISVVIAPSDPRISPLIPNVEKPWIEDLYTKITAAFKPFDKGY